MKYAMPNESIIHHDNRLFVIIFCRKASRKVIAHLRRRIVSTAATGLRGRDAADITAVYYPSYRAAMKSDHPVSLLSWSKILIFFFSIISDV